MEQAPENSAHASGMNYYYYYINPLYAQYLQLYTSNKSCPYGIYCCSCSVFTLCTTCNVISLLKYVLYRYISTSRSMCAVPNLAAVCSSLLSPFPSMLLRYCLSNFEIVPVATIITGITFCFNISHVMNFYCKVFIF